jgi:N,N'-diacetylchitobiose phosphorylase
MKYGHFDDEKKEYVITNPDTPEPWSNYLGSTTYGAIITNNAGGYSFYKSAAQGRYMRFRTNAIPMGQPGRYVYLRDMESGDYWGTTWQPVNKPLTEFKTVCRHGTAYTIIESEYKGIKTETTYFVPLGKEFECWHTKITNTGKALRKLRVFTFVEYASNWHQWMDLINLQYTQYILTMNVVDGIVDHGTNVYLPAQPDNFEEGGQARHTFLGVAGAKITGFDTDRKRFIGNHRSYSNPLVVEQGSCSNSLASGDNGCGVLQMEIELAPGESKELTVVMGIGSAGIEGKQAVAFCNEKGKITTEIDQLKNYWHQRLEGMTVKTPDAAVNSMLNIWSPYNCLMTYAWSRAASLVYAGERDGLGYRDTVQDMLGVLHMIPNEAVKRIELMLSGQCSNGGAMPVVKPFAHHPGKEKMPAETEFRSDDCMWLFNTVPAYVKESGDINFFNKIIPFADKGEATILGHLRKAIEFNLENSGVHGLPCGLAADWNDCLVLGQKGESVFVAMQLRFALVEYAAISQMLNLPDDVKWANENLKRLDADIEKHTWNGEWYLRAFRHDGTKYGAKGDAQGEIWLNPQPWSVISGHADSKRGRVVMDQVNKRLATEYGVMKIDPPYTNADTNVVKAPLFNPGMKENGAIFCHTQGWVIMAEALLGNGNQAFNYYKAYLPASFNDKADIREIEPYVYCQSTHGKPSSRFGASRLPWLSGAATWAFFSSSQYILGIQPDYKGLVINPCIPESWDGFEIMRRFRGKEIKISVKNPNKVQKGVKELFLNGEKMKTNLLPFELLKEQNAVEVIMGKTL